MNQIVCIGRLVNDLERTEENGIERTTLTLAGGIYERLYCSY